MIEVIWSVTRGQWVAYRAGVRKDQYEVDCDLSRLYLIRRVVENYQDSKIVIRPKV